jgi:hypothetical protein
MARKIIADINEGREIAKQRYGELRPNSARPTASPRPQDKESRRSGTGNTPQGYLTGAVSATSKPNFDAWADRKGRR